MMTNSKLLQEISEQTKVSNEELREKLRQQILDGTKENGYSVMREFTEKYRANFQELHDDIDNSISEMKRSLTSTFEKEISDHNESMKNRIEQLTEQLERESAKLKQNITDGFENHEKMLKSIEEKLSDDINDLKKDTAIIMESLQLILTNLLLDEVGK